MKKILLTLLCLSIILPFSQLKEASASALPSKAAVYLKAGKFFILYTKPAAPFMDKNQRLLVPLRVFEELFGGKVAYSTTSKTAQLEWLDHQFQFTVGSNKAEMDGQTVVMDTAPVLKNGAMFLPIRIFLDRADLKSHWDKKLQVLVLDDEKILTGQPFKNFDGNDLYSNSQDGAFRIDSYTITPKSNSTFRLTINATNVTGHALPKGKSDIHPLVSYEISAGGGFATDSYSKPFYPTIPEVKQDGQISVSQNFPAKGVDYIITVAREFADQSQ